MPPSSCAKVHQLSPENAQTARRRGMKGLVAMRSRVTATLFCLIVAGLCGCPQEEIVELQPPDAVGMPEADSHDEASVERLAWVSPEGRLMMADPEDPAQARQIGRFAVGVEPVSWSEDGRIIAYAAPDGALRRADLVDGSDTLIVPPAEAGVVEVAVSPDGSALAFISDAGLSVWRDGDIVRVTTPERPTSAAWSPDGSRLAIGAMGMDESVDGGLWLWSGGDAADRIVPPMEEAWGATQGIIWSPNGEWLAWARGAGDAWSGDLARSDGSELRRDSIASGPVAWLPDGSGLIVSVHIEAGASGTGIHRLGDDGITRVGPEHWDSRAALSPNGADLLVWGYEGRNLMVNTATGESSVFLETARIEDARWAPDGRLALLLTEDDTSVLWLGTAEGEELAAAPVEADPWWSARWLRLQPEAAVLAE